MIELGGIGPAPFAGMILADMGADVVRVERPQGEGLSAGTGDTDLLNRGKRSVALDLKNSAAIGAVLVLARSADVVIEGWRPGVAERLGVGPDDLRAENQALVYGRMTGWGQQGPLSGTAGHDITYLAVTGALHAIGAADGPPQIPLNLVGDFGGGSTYLVMGVLAALIEAKATGIGRTVDAAIVDGTAHLLTAIHGLLASGHWRDQRAVNLIDGGAPFYAVYRTSDGQYLAVGALEPQFYRQLVRLLRSGADPARQMDEELWPDLRREFGRIFLSRTSAEWLSVFDGSDACVAPVLSLRAAAEYPHLRYRGSLTTQNGVLQAGRAPRFSGPVAELQRPPMVIGQHTVEVLRAAGVQDLDVLLETGAAIDRS